MKGDTMRVFDLILFHINRARAIAYNHFHKQAEEAMPEAVEGTAEDVEEFYRSYRRHPLG